MIHVNGRRAYVRGRADKVYFELARAVEAIDEAMQDKNIPADTSKRILEGVFNLALNPNKQEEKNND